MDSYPDIIARATATAAAIPNWGPTLIAVSLSLTSIAFSLVLLRLFYRWHVAQLGWDDLCVLISVLFSIGHSIDDVIAVRRFGYGKHEVDLPASIRNNGGANLGFWISQIFTKPSLCFVRLSFCFLYLRVFRGLSGRRRMVIKCVMAGIASYYFAATMATLLTCLPIHRNWDKSIPGTCIDNLIFIYVNASANIIIDLIVVALPIPVIAKMQRNRKEIATGTILLAIPSILVSIVRLPTLKIAILGAKPGGDTSWDLTQSSLWTIAELNVPIMACCLVVLIKPIIDILSPVLKRVPFLASRFASKAYGGSSEYAQNSKFGNKRSRGVSRLNDSKGRSRTGDDTLVTIGGGGGGGRGVLGNGAGGKSFGDVTSDGASDESILGHGERDRYYGDVGVAVAGPGEREAHELEEYKQGGIVKTLSVDVNVSHR